MRVQDIMISQVSTCDPATSLEAAATTMWEQDCGALAVIDEQRHPIAMITDRDICMASALQHRPLAEMKVSDVIRGHEVKTCRPDQDIKDALHTMQQARVRRLPVVDNKGRVQGILSISDIIVTTPNVSGKGHDLPASEVLQTMKSVSAHHQAA